MSEVEIMEMHNPPHPGELVREALGGGQVTAFAKKLGVNRVTLSRLLNGDAGISAQMAVSLAEALGTSAEMWLGMQMQYDLWHARNEARAKSRISIKPFKAATKRRSVKRAVAA
jgi:addiction module HigA family antidote